MPLDLNELKNIVANRDFGRLIGELEGQFLDAKGQPYQFDSGMYARRELAKDVAAFANARGGFILIGLTTKPAAVSASEEISELRPVPQAKFDSDQHRKILVEWLYPQPQELEIAWLQFGDDKDKGIGMIWVPPQSDRSKPFLITRTLDDKKSTELLIGYAERHLDRTEVRTIVEIHQALRTGLNLERELLGRIANIEGLVERYFSAKTEGESIKRRQELFKERIKHLLEEDRV